MDIQINNKIISEKYNLRRKSKDFFKNFLKIENYIKKEVKEIENFKNSKKSIIPEINFKELSNKNDEIIIEDIKSEQDSDIKKIKITEPSDTLEQSGGVKRIKLDQKYNFF